MSLGEPIKVGHHSETRHRNLIKRNWNRLDNAFSEYDNEEKYLARASYWEKESKNVNLGMHDCISFYELQLEEAINRQTFLKKTPAMREHAYQLAYATKKVSTLKALLKKAKILWV